MKRRLVVEFTKMSGAGNDFIVIDNRFYHFSAEEFADMAPRICTRRHGIGADGILALEDPQTPSAQFRMLYFNADGSEGTMCGNGARCLARYAVNAGIPAGTLIFDTASGPYTAHVPASSDQPVRLHLRPAADWRPSLLLSSDRPLPTEDIHYLWTGTEHVVCFVPDVRRVAVRELGRQIRNDPTLAPQGANVNFVQRDGPSRLIMRTYEKGVEAETLACGTGAVAAALSAQYLGYVSADLVEVAMPGGTVRVGTGTSMFLEGPARPIYRGSFELED